MEVQSCIVSPHSDSRASPSWPVILNGCSREPSFILTPQRKESGRRGGTPEEDEDADEGEDTNEDDDDDVEEVEEEEEDDVDDKEEVSSKRWVKAGQPVGKKGKMRKRSRRESDEGQTVRAKGAEEKKGKEAEVSHLRFSFVLRPVFNNSIHFLHCSLRQCNPGTHTSTGAAVGTAVAEGVERRCREGGVAMPALLKAQLTSQKVRTLAKTQDTSSE